MFKVKDLALGLGTIKKLNIPELFQKNPNLFELIRRVAARQVFQTELIARNQPIDEYTAAQKEKMVAAMGALITAINRMLEENPNLPEPSQADELTHEQVMFATVIAALANGAGSGSLTLEQPPIPMS